MPSEEPSLGPSSAGAILAACGIATISVYLLLRNTKNGSKCDNESKTDGINFHRVCGVPTELVGGAKEQLSEQYDIGSAHPYTKKAEFSGCIYLDYNATTPIFPQVSAAIIPFVTVCFGNPSSAHVFSQPCKLELAKAREEVAALINVPNNRDNTTGGHSSSGSSTITSVSSHTTESEVERRAGKDGFVSSEASRTICFTSCGTESDNRAVDIALHYFRYNFRNLQTKAAKKAEVKPCVDIPHIITSAVEHPAIINYLQLLELRGSIALSIIPVSREGFVDVKQVTKALQPHTALVTIMHSNNEVGTIQPIREIAQAIKRFRMKTPEAVVLFHSDAAQSLGKVLVDVQSLGVDMLTIVGHKFGAPKGVAALYIRKALRDEIDGSASSGSARHSQQGQSCALLVGGGQEGGLRGGTENVALIAGLGAASRLALSEASDLLLHMLTLKLRLINGLLQPLSEKERKMVRFNGPQRANDPIAITGDLKMLRVMLNQSQQQQLLQQAGTAAAPSALSLGRADGKGTRDSSSMSASPVQASAPGRKQLASPHLRLKMAADLVEQLPNTVSVSFKGVQSHKLVGNLADVVACSAGSACHAGSVGVISGVLHAMGLEPEYASGTLRLSFGRHTDAAEIDRATTHILSQVRMQWKDSQSDM